MKFLWGNQAKARWLVVTSLFLILTCLGGKEIWTQEHRWADIVSGMFFRGDFLHPYLGEARYYDKPLLSYWLIVAATWLTNGLNTWALRIPSALAGLLAVWSIFQIGKMQRDRSYGLLCGWMLVTTFYFIFWARVSSADMLNVGGSLAAIAWYFYKKQNASFLSYSVFFIILALTSLCKGLGGAVVPVLAVFADICLERSIKYHLRPALFLALIPAILIYVFPFWLSSHFDQAAYGENGLYLVYRENVLRYFQPFDHQGPIYTYFIYLPIYLMPWTLFFIPALFSIPARLKHFSASERWNLLTLLFIFVFFSLSGSRRSYYVLPMVPFAVLVTADWIASANLPALRQRLAGFVTIISALLIFLVMDILPAWYYSQYGVERFAVRLQHEASKQHPWSHYQVVMLDAETKLSFYLQLPPTVKNYDVKGRRKDQTEQTLQASWPALQHPAANTIYISRKLYEPILDKKFPLYLKVMLPRRPDLPFVKENNENMPVAYIPIE